MPFSNRCADGLQGSSLLWRQAFGLGASSRLIAKPFLCADPRRFASGSAWFVLVRVASAVALLLSASYGSQRPHALSPSHRRRPAGAVTGCALEASFRSGNHLALDCKAFFMRGSKALRFGIRLVCACTGDFCCGFAAQRFVRLPTALHFASFTPSKASRGGDGMCFGGKLSVRELPCA